jgi:hypothetical protein
MAKEESQVEKFREAAKDAGTDDSEERFNATLKDMAKSPRGEARGPERTQRRGQTETLVAVHRRMLGGRCPLAFKSQSPVGQVNGLGSSGATMPGARCAHVQSAHYANAHTV